MEAVFDFDTSRGVHVLRVTNPRQLAAEERAQSVVDEASLNEAIRVIETLVIEVQTMDVAERFNCDKKPSEGMRQFGGTIAPSFRALSEPEYKRAELLTDLASAKARIVLEVSKLYSTVMEIEATKRE